MLAYAANRPDPAARRSSPNVMLFIVAVHIAAIAALMSAKMDLPIPLIDKPLRIDLIPELPPPPPVQDHHAAKTQRPVQDEQVYRPDRHVVTDATDRSQVDTTDKLVPDGSLTIGKSVDPPPPARVAPIPVQAGPMLLTPASQLRPPYPEMKLLNEEEADLRLRLSITADGRVASVDAVGKADPVFLDAARRYITGHWRYRPATVDGRAIASNLVISLSFRLDG